MRKFSSSLATNLFPTDIISLWTKTEEEEVNRRGHGPTDSSGVSETSGSPTPSKEFSIDYDTGFSTSSSVSPTTTVTIPTIKTGRGRGRALPLPKNLPPPSPYFPISTSKEARTMDAIDPYWTVSDLTNSEFQSLTRVSKPDELGKIGRQIEVIANYFRILQFPQHGLVYRYHIQMRDKRNEEMHRDRRR